MLTGKRIVNLFALTAIVLTTASANADVILADDFADVGDAEKVANTATFGSWNTVNGINAPATSLSFFDGDDGTTPVNFHEVTDGELDVNQNMTAGGWDTSIEFTVSGANIDLTSLVLDLRLINGSGGPNSTTSKSGRMIAVLEGSTSGVIGTIDPGNSAYPSVAYQRTLDLSSLPELDTSETYTLTIQARGIDFGHHKSLQSLELNGTILVPTPAALPAGLAMLGLVAMRRRRSK